MLGHDDGDDNQSLPPPKRRRMEATTSATPTIPVQHERFWFADGNVVLSTTEVAFKLHRGVLALHSEVFRDMFEAPHTGEGDEILEGCPVIHITDCGEHMGWFLALLYDGAKDPFFNRDYVIPFTTLRAVLILAYKYEVDHIRMEALSRLKLQYPSNFNEWDTGHLTGRSLRTVALRLEDSIGFVNLTRMFNISSLLPIALWLCSILPLERLLTKVNYGHGQYEQLSEDDIRLCLRAVNTLSNTNRIRLNLFLDFEPAEGCSNPIRCSQAVRDMTRAASDRGCFIFEQALLPLDIIVPEVHTLCPACGPTLLAEFRRCRRTIWDSLGTIFEEPGPTA